MKKFTLAITLLLSLMANEAVAQDENALETPVTPTVGNIYLIRNIGGYYASSNTTEFTEKWDKVIYSPDEDATDITFQVVDYDKLIDADHDIDHLTTKYYWVLNETTVNGTTYYYFSNCAGTGYMGRTTGTIYGGDGGTSNSVPGITTNLDDAFLFKSLNIPVYGTNYYSGTYNTSYNRSTGTVIGYNMEFLYDDSSTRYLTLGVDQSNSTTLGADELNWMNHGSTWYYNSAGKSNYYWSTAYSLDQVDYSHVLTLYRHDNGYTLKTGETNDYFCTLYLPYAANLDTDLEVYCINTDAISTDNDGGTVTLTKLTLGEGSVTTTDNSGNTTTTTTQVLPANTPVLLRMPYEDVTDNTNSTITTTVSLADYSKASVSGNTSNALTGVPVITELTDYKWEEETTAPIYVLSKKNGRVAMYRLVGSTSGANAKVNAFTAYYNTANNTSSETTSANVNSLTFVFKDINDSSTTGIQTVNTEETVTDNAIYDLQGRRVEKPSKGIYIKNGKKYLVK